MSATPITCPACQADLDPADARDGVIRCGICGTKTAAPPPDESPAPAVRVARPPEREVPRSRPVATPAARRPKSRRAEDDEEDDDRPGKRVARRGNKSVVGLVIGLAVVLFIVVAAGGVVVWWAVSRSENKPDVPAGPVAERSVKSVGPADRPGQFAPLPPVAPQPVVPLPNNPPPIGPPVMPAAPAPAVEAAVAAPAGKPPAVPPVTPATLPVSVRPAAHVLPITPTAAADGAVVKLPSSADRVCLGGGGRFVVLRLPRDRQLAVFDVSAGKVAKYLPLAEDGAVFAAGMDKLFVLNPAANVIQRWDLTSFAKEVTAPNPLGGAPKLVLMGHATDGPLYVAGNRVNGNRHFGFADGRTFRQVEVPGDDGRSGPGVSDWYPPTVRVSADGRVYGWWSPGLSPSGLNSYVIGPGSAKHHHQHTSVGPILPGPDGTLFTGAGLFTPELKPVGEPKGYQYWFFPPVPAAHGPAYLSVQNASLPGGRGEKPRVAVKLLGDDRPVATLPDLPGLDLPAGNNNTNPGPGLPLYDRLFLVPDAKALVVLNGAATALYVHRFDLKELLEQSGVDYLLVMSRPPAAARGAKYRYAPVVWSKKGGVKLKLEAGPAGMAVAAGAVTWDVPADHPAGDAPAVILTVSDAGGQEIFHTFTLSVGGT